MAANTYQTKQKQRILTCLQKNTEQAFTIDEITAIVNHGEGKVGRTTVYRYIETLLAEGKVRKFTGASGKGATFQYVHDPRDCERHMHLKCEGCGKYIHLNCSTMQDVNRHILCDHHFWVDNANSLLVGLCEECRKEGKHGTD